MIKFKPKEQAKVSPQRKAADQLLDKLKRTLEMEAGRGNVSVLLLQKIAPIDAVTGGKLKIGGNPMLLQTFFGLMDKFAGNFPVVDAAQLPE